MTDVAQFDVNASVVSDISGLGGYLYRAQSEKLGWLMKSTLSSFLHVIVFIGHPTHVKISLKKKLDRKET